MITKNEKNKIPEPDIHPAGFAGTPDFVQFPGPQVVDTQFLSRAGPTQMDPIVLPQWPQNH